MGRLLKNEPMSKHTTWRVGGLADQYFVPENKTDLIEFIQSQAPVADLFWLGLGSNVLVRDGGIRGIVIAQSGALNEIELKEPNVVYAEVGVSCAKLSRFSDRQGLSGLAFLSGIPGSVGGALAMNAGAFGSEIWPWVKQVQTIDKNGEIRTRDASDYHIHYREVVLKEPNLEWFLSAQFKLDKEPEQKPIKALLKQRNDSQPIGLPSCGSVFKNPKNHHAAKLIEQAGLKGHCIGAACVSDKHANFIINTGKARSCDIESLIHHVQAVVQTKFQVVLETEVKFVGQADEC